MKTKNDDSFVPTIWNHLFDDDVSMDENDLIFA